MLLSTIYQLVMARLCLTYVISAQSPQASPLLLDVTETRSR
jgi:hypothetical protein